MTRALRHLLQHGALDRGDCLLRSPTPGMPNRHWLPPRPWSVGLPQLVRPLSTMRLQSFRRRARPPRRDQQAAFTHHAQHTFAVHHQTLLTLHPPRHPAIAIRGLAPQASTITESSRRSAREGWRLAFVVQTGTADVQRPGHQFRFLARATNSCPDECACPQLTRPARFSRSRSARCCAPAPAPAA